MKVNSESIKLNDQQQEALKAMLEGYNVFLTGKAGSGKSLIINEYMRQGKFNTVILAPTGAAALLVGGSTIHSFFQLPIGVITPDNIPVLDLKQIKMLSFVETIIIDEVSMLRVDIFEGIDRLLKKYASSSKKHLPMGGKRIIVVGDFLQLPAFAKEKEVQKYLTDTYGGLQAFRAPAWKEAGFKEFCLETVFRQNDDTYLEILNAVRMGETTYWEKQLIAEYYRKPDVYVSNEFCHLDTLNNICYRPEQQVSYDSVCLCATNKMADMINTNAHAQLPGDGTTLTGKIKGEFPAKDLPVPLNLELKMGTKVMLRANKFAPANGGFEYVNGDIGTVVGIYSGTTPKVEVKLMNGHVVRVSQSSWSNYKYKLKTDADGKQKITQVEIGSYYQLPISLAWGISIHKSQGLTLNKAHIILGDKPCFCPGQLYVALSRVKSLKNLSTDRPIYSEDIIVDPEAIKLYKALAPEEAEKEQEYDEDSICII